jgi:hypothetical protein
MCFIFIYDSYKNWSSLGAPFRMAFSIFIVEPSCLAFLQLSKITERSYDLCQFCWDKYLV